MSLSKIFSNIAKNGTNALNATASFIEGQFDKKHKEEFNDQSSVKPRKKFGSKIMTDSEFERQKNKIEKWKKIANKADEFAKKNKLSTTEQQEYSEEKNIKPNVQKKKHNANKKEKNNLRKLDVKQARVEACARFNEYLQKFNLTDLVNKAKKDRNITLDSCLTNGNVHPWVYYGMMQNGKPHGIGVAVDPEYLNTIDDQLLMFKQGKMLDCDTLNTTNLGGVVMQGNDMKQCNEVSFSKNIKCVDFNSSTENISQTINDTFIDAKNNTNIEAYVVGLNMHGSKQGYIYDTSNLLLKSIKSFDEMHKKGIKIDKPCLIVKYSCFDARKEWTSTTQNDDYDDLCKTVSNCTNKNTVCVYHNNNSSTHWGKTNMFDASYDYAFDLYKDGKLIQKNITASQMNKDMDYTLNDGTWDIPDSGEKYKNFLEGLIKKEELEDTTQKTSFSKESIAVVGTLGVTSGAAIVLSCLSHHKKCCWKEDPKLNSQDNNSQTSSKNNQHEAAQGGQNSEREPIPHEQQTNDQKPITTNTDKVIPTTTINIHSKNSRNDRPKSLTQTIEKFQTFLSNT